jgi:hypothetical protein
MPHAPVEAKKGIKKIQIEEQYGEEYEACVNVWAWSHTNDK